MNAETSLFPTEPGNTLLTPEETLDLIPSISYRGQLNLAERSGIITARAWAMGKSFDPTVNKATDVFARELHYHMFRRVWRWAGKYRTTERNLGWDAYRIPEGMRNLMDDFAAWVQFGTYTPHEAVIRLHHRMVVIHPWPNGNGRHARLMADVLLQAYFKDAPALHWGQSQDLTAGGGVRGAYIKALQEADRGDFGPLLSFAS